MSDKRRSVCITTLQIFKFHCFLRKCTNFIGMMCFCFDNMFACVVQELPGSLTALLFFRVSTTLESCCGSRTGISSWFLLITYLHQFTPRLPNKQRSRRSVEISALFSYSHLEEGQKVFYGTENLTISRLAFCTLCYL